ncbi:cytochrome P450 protein [Artemisia annua]|uniref:Cytochrome P450 protein n=1 Tax=Artemisia annua TaxID=35608 RepID=A0A2U1QGA1_ARTAN|nr:cytochrome P450 protein [Artemisia annua]
MELMKNLVILLAILLFVSLILLIVKFLHKVFWMPNHIQNVMRSQGIKGPSYKFLHGNTKEILDMRMKPMGRPMDHLSHEIFPRIMPHVHSWVSLYGRNYLNWYGPQAQLVVTEAELIKEIMNNKDGVYPKIDLEGHAKKLLGDGLSSTKGDKWTKLRKIANGVFHGESLKSMIPSMITSTETMLQKWKEHNGQEIEVFEEFRVLTSEVIYKTAFGSSYLEGKKIFDMLMNKLIKNNDDIESDKLERGIKDCIVKIIRKRDQENSMDMGINDFLGELLEASRDKDDLKRITLDDMVDECKTFYFAGHETTTSLLGWTILLLATYQEWQEKARKEVFEFFAKANPNQDSITRLKIMNMIVEESLRLYPPVPALKRRVKTKVRLGKMTLPPNMELYISILAVHHDPRIWGEDVYKFKPDRFEGGKAEATNNTPAAFLPFGFGPRTCVGCAPEVLGPCAFGLVFDTVLDFPEPLAGRGGETESLRLFTTTIRSVNSMLETEDGSFKKFCELRMAVVCELSLMIGLLVISSDIDLIG